MSVNSFYIVNGIFSQIENLFNVKIIYSVLDTNGSKDQDQIAFVYVQNVKALTKVHDNYKVNEYINNTNIKERFQEAGLILPEEYHFLGIEVKDFIRSISNSNLRTYERLNQKEKYRNSIDLMRFIYGANLDGGFHTPWIDPLKYEISEHDFSISTDGINHTGKRWNKYLLIKQMVDRLDHYSNIIDFDHPEHNPSKEHLDNYVSEIKNYIAKLQLYYLEYSLVGINNDLLKSLLEAEAITVDYLNNLLRYIEQSKTYLEELSLKIPEGSQNHVNYKLFSSCEEDLISLSIHQEVFKSG